MKLDNLKLGQTVFEIWDAYAANKFCGTSSVADCKIHIYERKICALGNCVDGNFFELEEDDDRHFENNFENGESYFFENYAEAVVYAQELAIDHFINDKVRKDESEIEDA